jgi:hypothetical protein
VNATVLSTVSASAVDLNDAAIPGLTSAMTVKLRQARMELSTGIRGKADADKPEPCCNGCTSAVSQARDCFRQMSSCAPGSNAACRACISAVADEER